MVWGMDLSSFSHMDFQLEYHWTALVCLLKIYLLYLRSSISQPYSIPLISVSIPPPIPCCLNYHSFIRSHKIEWCNSSTLFFFLKIVLTILVQLSFPMNFWISLSIYKNSWWHFDWIFAKSVDQFQEGWHLHYVESSGAWTP